MKEENTGPQLHKMRAAGKEVIVVLVELKYKEHSRTVFYYGHKQSENCLFQFLFLLRRVISFTDFQYGPIRSERRNAIQCYCLFAMKGPQRTGG